MEPKALYKNLWENVQSLMRTEYGQEKLGEFAKKAGIGAASMTRIKQHETAVGIDTICKIASAFNLNPWQLLAPKLGEGLYFFHDQNPQPVFHGATPYAPPPSPPDTPPSGNRERDRWKRTREGKERDTARKVPTQHQRRRSK